jgi:PAS domain S-box-containing protein
MNKTAVNEKLEELNLPYHLENTPLGVIGFNQAQQIVYWSEGATEIFEWEADEVLHRPASTLNFIFEEDQELVSEKITEILSGAVSRNQCSNRNYTKSGKVVFCEWYNSALQVPEHGGTTVLSFIHEATKSKEETQQLEYRQQQLSLIYNSAIDPMWLINIEEGTQFRFESINSAFTQVTGLTPDNVIGLLMEDVLPQTSHQLVREKYTEAMQTKKVVDYVEVARHPAGVKVGEIRVIPVSNDWGQVTKIVGIAHDITERRALQEKLDEERDLTNKRITAAVLKSQEIERTNISRELHDNVNQVLTTVKLYAELCAAKAVDVDQYLPKCVTILNDTINEIRRLSKQLASPPFSAGGLPEAIKDLAESVHNTQKVTVSTSIDSFCCTVVDEELQLATYRIAQEQFNNILKHANAAHVFVQLSCTSTRLSLSITDDGIGFDVSQKGGGLGITNMISRANLFNGEFSLQSEEGKGCTLTVSFPVEYAAGKCSAAGTNVEGDCIACD